MTDQAETVETSEQYRDRIRRAEKAHELRVDGSKIHASAIDSYSTAAMKAPALVAAGGLVAALGFYSANYSRLSAHAGRLEAFNSVIFWLFLCLLMTVIAPGIAYFSQLAYGASISSEQHSWDHPFVIETRRSHAFRVAGDVFRWLTVAVVATSIGCLMMGGYKFFELMG